MTLLRNALLQTGWTQDQVHELNLANKLSERFRNTDWRIVRRDVAPFLERNEEVELLNEVDMTKLLSRI
jgi:spore coat polysaccharide biosynthesis protein SpsF (cytidylyltransferase family)